ncbi:RICIN domain-containing protein [Actinokineospora soli]|uniref:RICIN domain-containing protein n=1 Tax=Actinokineospora soli TaxID=1048753 RepID=A0ABW2TMQ6_9PSEU
MGRRVHRQRRQRPPAADLAQAAHHPTPPPAGGALHHLRGRQQVLQGHREGGQTVGDIHNGDWIAFTPYSLGGQTTFSARVSSAGAGGTLQVRLGSPTGTVLGSATVPVTGGWDAFTTVQGALAGAPAGSSTLYLTFAGGAGALYDVDSFTIGGSGVGPVVGASGKCADVDGGATADGTKVQLWTCNGTQAQTWSRAGQTWKALGKCLDISGGSTADGALVQLWTCNGTGAQNWVAGTGGTLVNPQSNKCLDASGGATADGTRLIIWTCHGGTNQRWTTP